MPIFAIPGLGFYIIANSRSFNQNQATVAVLLLALVGVFGVLAVVIIDLRLRQRLYEYSSEQLLRASL